MHQDTFYMYFCVLKNIFFLRTNVQWYVDSNKSFLTCLTDVCLPRMCHSKSCFRRFLVIYFIPYKVFPAQNTKQNKTTHTHNTPPPPNIKQYRNTYLNYHSRFRLWWFHWLIEKNPGLTPYGVVLDCKGAN